MGILAVSFMTDVPAFAFAMLSMAAGVRALRDEAPSMPWVLASMALGYVAFSIRDYAGVPAAAIAIVAVLQALHVRERRVVRVTIGAAVLTAIAALAFMWVWRHVPDGKSLRPTFPTHHSLSTLLDKGGGMLRLAGLWLSPLLLLRGPNTTIKAAWHASKALTITTVVVAGTWLAVPALRLPRLGFAG